MKINGVLKDYSGAIRVIGKRKKKYNNANEEYVDEDKIGKLAKKLHPGKIKLRLTKIEESANSKILRFEGDNIPYFKPGQYLTVEYDIDDNHHITRPYSIISSPRRSFDDKPYVEICVCYNENSISGKYLYDNAKIGDEFITEIGLGRFTYNSLRDSKNVVAIAGGAGITPFLSYMEMINEGYLDINLTVIHGVNDLKNMVLAERINKFKSDKIKVIYVVRDSNSGEYESGLINKEIIKKYSKDDSSYFICGSNEMYEYLLNELNELNVEKRRIRKEIYSSKNIECKNKYKLEVVRGINSVFIDCYDNETIATTLEKNNIKIHTSCRSGICGLCRIRILSGEFYIDEKNDNRRMTDKEYNYVYACSCYPRSDLKIKINI